jgi:hypothetical protein
VVADSAFPHGYDPQMVGIGLIATNTQLIDDGSYAKIIAKCGLLLLDSAQINQGGKPLLQ